MGQRFELVVEGGKVELGCTILDEHGIGGIVVKIESTELKDGKMVVVGYCEW